MDLSGDLNYHHLRYFWAVAHEGNLTRAAERLHVTASAVSVQIRKLEDSVGHALFARRGRALELTEAGRITLRYADEIFAAGDELVGVLREPAGTRRRELRVGALATLSRNFQIGFVAPLLARDDVEVVIRSGALASMLAELEAHRLDVVLANVSPPRTARSPWVPHAIAEQPVSLVGQPGAEADVPLEALLEREPLVMPTKDSSIRTGFDALVARLGVRPRIVAEVDDMAMLRLVARAHQGLAVVPPIVVKDELDGGRLIEVVRLPGLTETFFAITMARGFPNPLLEPLIGADDEPRGAG
ncbi:MAG TPA: LysR family transcriptional regulator [Sandaracinaceae bacterium LLY-WYZ-13_1]|nr:LysR family transcriptional regulator [Sandaracinaceae bacterium LLY-WYZ-13_1]